MKKQKYLELTLCISGRPLDVNALSGILKLAPTSVRAASEYPACVPEELRQDEWCLTVRKTPCTALEEVFEALKCILMRPFTDGENKEHPLMTAADAVKSAAEALRAKVSLVIVSDMAGGELPELVLSPENVEFAHRMGAEIGFDIGG